MRLRWVSALSTRGEEALYRLPLASPPPRDVSLRVEVAGAPARPQVTGGPGRLDLSAFEGRWVAEARGLGRLGEPHRRADRARARLPRAAPLGLAGHRRRRRRLPRAGRAAGLLPGRPPGGAPRGAARGRDRRRHRTAADGRGVADLEVAPGGDPSRPEVLGRLTGQAAELTLGYASGSRVVERRTVRLERSQAGAAGERPGPVSTAWAQARLEALSAQPERNAAALLALGPSFGLVSDATSLLVLETPSLSS